jgi:hypothetical protein
MELGWSRPRVPYHRSKVPWRLPRAPESTFPSSQPIRIVASATRKPGPPQLFPRSSSNTSLSPPPPKLALGRKQNLRRKPKTRLGRKQLLNVSASSHQTTKIPLRIPPGIVILPLFERALNETIPSKSHRDDGTRGFGSTGRSTVVSDHLDLQLLNVRPKAPRSFSR